MSEDRSQLLSADSDLSALIHVQPAAQAKDESRRWDDATTIRLYGQSVERTALQIRGRLKSPAAPPAFAHASLTDEDLLWLYHAVRAKLKERGVAIGRSYDLDAESVD